MKLTDGQSVVFFKAYCYVFRDAGWWNNDHDEERCNDREM